MSKGEILEQILDDDRSLEWVFGLYTDARTCQAHLLDLLRAGHIRMLDEAGRAVEPWGLEALYRDRFAWERAKRTHLVSITDEGANLV